MLDLSGPSPTRVGAAVFAALTLFSPALTSAQDAPLGRLPRIVFLVEDSDAMLEPWQGGGGAPGSRWHYVQEAIADVLSTAPPSLEFAVVMSPNGRGNEQDGFERVAPFGWERRQSLEALAHQGASQMGRPERRLAEGYANLIEHWMANSGNTRPVSQGHNGASLVNTTVWRDSPFALSCDELVVLVIGTGSDLQAAGAVSRTSLSPNPPGGYVCSLGADGDGGRTSLDDCLLDNVAHYAHHSWVSPHATSGVVSTHTILVDPDAADPHAEALYRAATQVGSATPSFHAAGRPDALRPAIQASLNAALSGTYGGGGVTVSPRGDRMFSTFYEVDGHPLAEGHLLGFDLDTRPESSTYGQVLPGSAAQGARWDAGELLASRTVAAGERNQNGFSPTGPRNGLIAPSTGETFSAFEPFDSQGVQSGDLASLLVRPVAASANPRCAPLEHDYDFDCDSDADDAQHIVDFIRGVPTSTFRGSSTQRGVRRLGDAGLGRPVYAPAGSATIGTDRAFAEYQAKLTTRPSMVYLASNAGMLHGFDAGDGHERWFVVPRAKARWDARNEYDGHRIQDLVHAGRRDVNSGQLNLQHVWMDGYLTGLPGCPGPSFDFGAKDGKEDEDGCEWHRVLVWSGGPGARHSYAVDVTDPDAPRFLWERTDESATGAGQGRATGSVAMASFVDRGGPRPEMRWLTVTTAGPQGPAAAPGADPEHWAQATLYVRDLEESLLAPTLYPEGGFPVPAPRLRDPDRDGMREYDPGETEGLFGTPGLADLDGDGSVDVGYFGDSLGTVYKVRFRSEEPDAPKICVFAEADAADGSGAFHPPSVFFDGDQRLMVWWATGSPQDRDDPDATGGLYARMDPDPFGCRKSEPAPCAQHSSLFSPDGFHGFGGAGEKSVGALTVRDGHVFAATYVRSADLCSVGASRLYGVDVSACEGGLYDEPGDGYTVRRSLFTEIEGLASEPVYANGRLYTLVSASGVAGEVRSVQVRPDQSAPAYFVARREF